MKRILALVAILPIAGCEAGARGGGGSYEPAPTARTEAVSDVLTYSDACRTGGMDNWVLSGYQCGIEEILSHAQTSTAGTKTGGVRIDATSSSGTVRSGSSSQGMDSSGTSKSAGTGSTSRVSDQKTDSGTAKSGSTHRDVDSSGTSKSAGTGSSATHSDQKSDETTAKTSSQGSQSDQKSTSESAKTKSDATGTDVDTKGETVKSGSDPTSIDQQARGRLVIWAKDVLEMLRRNKVDAQSLKTRNLDVLEVDRSFVVAQGASLLRVAKAVATDRAFDEMLARSDIDYGRVYVYSVRLTNLSKHPLSGVKFVDVLPDGMELEGAWMSESMKRSASSSDTVLFDVFKDGARSAIVWGVRDSIPAGAEVTVTFGAVKK